MLATAAVSVTSNDSRLSGSLLSRSAVSMKTANSWSPSDWPEILTAKRRLLLAQPCRVRQQHLDHTADDPAIDGRRELVALGGATGICPAERWCPPRRSCAAAVRIWAWRGAPFNGTIVCASSRKRWSSSAERTVPISVDVGVAPHDALVAVGVDLDAIAAAVLGRLAGDLGRGQRVRQRMLALGDDGDAEARRDIHRSAARARSSSFSKPTAQVLGRPPAPRPPRPRA